MHYSVSSIAANINSHSHSCSTFDLYQLVHLQRARCEKYCLDSVLYRVCVTNYFHGQNSIFGHMPLYITISVESYNLLTQLFHISSYQNKTITLSGIWHLYLSYTVYQWHHSIFESHSVLRSAMAKLFKCLNQPKFNNFAPECSIWRNFTSCHGPPAKMMK
jgi:hypothetical protein